MLKQTKKWLASSMVAILLVAMTPVMAAAVTPTEVDLTLTGAVEAAINDGIWTQWVSNEASGTGRFNTYLALQAGQTGIERGFNTGGKRNFDEKPQTKALPLANVPLVTIEGVAYREFAFDVNQTAGSPKMSVDLFAIYQTNNDKLTTTTLDADGYPEFPVGQANKIYDIDGYYVLVDYNIGSGSGSANYLLYVKNSLFDQNYGYVIMFAQHGQYGDRADNGFNEWGIRVMDPVEELTVTKTAETSFVRTHLWDIDKWVTTENGHELEDGTPVIHLTEDGLGDEKATWHVKVTYEGYDDSEFAVSGTITIVNTGTAAAVITGVVDEIDGEFLDVDFENITFPYNLAVGAQIVGTYGGEVTGKLDGPNVVTVTTEKGDWYGNAAVVWGDPDTEIDDVVTIEDDSDLNGVVELGTVTAPDGDTFTYDEDFTWETFGETGVTVYNNKATIVETGQYAEAKLQIVKIVTEPTSETAWAFGGDNAIPFASKWGWTNGAYGAGEYTLDLYAGAGNNDLEKGTHVGEVEVVYNGSTATVTYTAFEGFYFTELHLWVGSTPLPMVGRGPRAVATDAPGQFPHKMTFDPGVTTYTFVVNGLNGNIYVAAHAVVWGHFEHEEEMEEMTMMMSAMQIEAEPTGGRPAQVDIGEAASFGQYISMIAQEGPKGASAMAPGRMK